jgi:FkbM family methyltransferase
MTRSLFRQAVQSSLAPFGLQVVKTTDAFAMQVKLTQKSEPVIFDVGAADGGVAKTYRESFPKARLHCFEPFPGSFEGLKRNFGSDPRAVCVQKAVADRDDIAILHANTSSATNSLLPMDERSAEFWGTGIFERTGQVSVVTTSVDDYCEQAKVSHIDILKIDVQGAEWGVLQGERRMLREHRVSLIYTELIVSPTYKGQRKLHEYLSFFDELGYELLDFYSPVRRNGRLLQADAILLPIAPAV